MATSVGPGLPQGSREGLGWLASANKATCGAKVGGIYRGSVMAADC